MKAQYHLLIAVVSYVILAYEYIYHMDIITEPYMFFLIIFLFGLGGWNLGAGIAKLFQMFK